MKTKTTEGSNVETEGTSEDRKAEMTEKLKESGKRVEAAAAQRRERTVKGAHLLGRLLEAISASGNVLTENTGFHVVKGVAKGRIVYLAKKGGRADLNGFTLDHPAIRQISEEEAKTKHLGKVRGTVDFDTPDEAVLEAFGLALAALTEVTEEPAKPVPAPKKTKAPKDEESPKVTATDDPADDDGSGDPEEEDQGESDGPAAA